MNEDTCVGFHPHTMPPKLEAARVVDMGNGHQVLVIASSPSRPEEPAAETTWLRRHGDVLPVLVSSIENQGSEGISVKSENLANEQDTGGLTRVLTLEEPTTETIPLPRPAPLHGGDCQEVGGTQQGLSAGTAERLAGGLSQSLVVHDDQHALLTGYAKEVFGTGYLQPQSKPRPRLTPKERNRLAQKRFRDRQKALISSLQAKVNELTALVRHYHSRTADLERENLDLVDALRKRGVAWPAQK